MFQGAILAFRVLNMLNTYTNSLGKNLALDLFVDYGANSVLGNMVDTSCFAMGRFGGIFEQCPSLDRHLSCGFTCT